MTEWRPASPLQPRCRPVEARACLRRVNIEKGRQHLAAHQVYIFASALKVRPEALLPSHGEDGSFVARKLPADVDKAIIKWAEKLG